MPQCKHCCDSNGCAGFDWALSPLQICAPEKLAQVKAAAPLAGKIPMANATAIPSLRFSFLECYATSTFLRGRIGLIVVSGTRPDQANE